MKYYLGLDIGGTSIKSGVLSATHKLVYKNSFRTRSADGEQAIIDDIISECARIFGMYKIECIGVGCPGDKDDANVSIVTAGNLPFYNLPIVDILQKRFGVEVYLENDGSCALIADWLAGAGKGCTDMVEITVGTGIGGGCVVNGDLMRGVTNDAGELGHFVIDPRGEKCPCGQKGCFERFASATALIKMTRKAAESNPGSVLAEECADGVDGRTVFNAYAKGCPVAKRVLKKFAKNLATGINGLDFIFAPQYISLAGGIMNQGDVVLKFLRPYLLHPQKVGVTTLHGDAGVIGAALLWKFKKYYLSLR